MQNIGAVTSLKVCSVKFVKLLNLVDNLMNLCKLENKFK